jgi:hypothetical protein
LQAVVRVLLEEQHAVLVALVALVVMERVVVLQQVVDVQQDQSAVQAMFVMRACVFAPQLVVNVKIIVLARVAPVLIINVLLDV